MAKSAHKQREDLFVFFLRHVFAQILPFKDGYLQKKRFSVSPVAFESTGAEREGALKDVVFRWFGFRLPP